ncbi:MAG TPA: ABC transporter substrate-binding protein [Candidatus Enterococcus avicola]|jgi:NitT/TauT family transport system substrate-binding protein|uniref:ABC transporter substrate-binding protein n=1 Tax=Candidatus Enterococcus avicola TaxID=2838561 RepID=A0A9D2JHE9_9ENTE|nr:ABC transporter substrate-binding protein [Candidatus Enterococcus avicola]
MKKIMISMTIALLLTLTACGAPAKDKTNESSAGSNDITTLKVGVMPSMDNIPLIVAHEQGFDKKHGIELDVQAFKSGKDRDAAFQAGAVDSINADLVGVAAYIQAGIDVKIMSATQGQFDLISTAEVKEVADLKGKEVVVLKNQGPEFATEEFLKQVNLTGEDVKMVDVPQVPSRVELLSNNQASAAILPEPFVTMTTAQGMNNLGSTLDLGINLFALIATQDVIDEKSMAFKGMYDAYNDAVQWMKENDQEAYIQLFIDEIGFPETLKEQIVIPEYKEAFQASEEDITRAFDWAKTKGLLEKDVLAKDVLSDVYFK